MTDYKTREYPRVAEALTHEEHPFMFANVDRLVVGEISVWSVRQPIFSMRTNGSVELFCPTTLYNAITLWL